MPQTKKV